MSLPTGVNTQFAAGILEDADRRAQLQQRVWFLEGRIAVIRTAVNRFQWMAEEYAEQGGDPELREYREASELLREVFGQLDTTPTPEPSDD